MHLPDVLSTALSPPAETSRHDTGLRFTDIIFGFIITEIFLRLQEWSSLGEFSRTQLLCSTALVLGSWIGFRRSLNRPEYELKFFNLPLFRFLLDQAMLVLYFRVATLTPADAGEPVDISAVTESTVEALALVFGLYLAWDLAGQMMACSNPAGKKYAESHGDVIGPLITLAALLVALGLWRLVQSAESLDETAIMVASASLLVLYRWAKDIRSALRRRPTAELHPTPGR